MAKGKFETLSREDLLRLLVKALDPDRGEEVPRRSRAKAAAEEPAGKSKAVDWTQVKHTCPKCSHKGPVDPDFGVKLVRGIARSQSWCKRCRATTSYYGKERTYRQG